MNKPMTIVKVDRIPSWVVDYLYPMAVNGNADYYGTETASCWWDIQAVDREAEPMMADMKRVYLVFRKGDPSNATID